MQISRTHLAGAFVAAALVLGSAGAARAQEPAPTLTGKAHAGIALPGGGLADITSAGPTVGVTGVYRFLPNFGARLDGTLDMMDGTQDSFGNLFPSMKLLHITGGIQIELPRPEWQDVPFTTTFHAGVGLTHMDANQSDVTGPVGQFSKTYFSVTSGLDLGWQFTPNIGAYAAADAHLALGKRGQLQVFADHSPEVGAFRNVWTFPITAGLRLTTNPFGL